MDAFTAYRQAEQPSLRLYAPYWLPARKEAHVPLGDKRAMLKAARRGNVKSILSRRIAVILRNEP